MTFGILYILVNFTVDCFLSLIVLGSCNVLILHSLMGGLMNGSVLDIVSTLSHIDIYEDHQPTSLPFL